MMVLSINARVYRAKNKLGLKDVDFEVLRVSKSPAKVLNEMAAYVAGVMATQEDEETPFDPLELKKFTADDGSYIADCLITCGGPTCSVRYESRKDTAVISFKWGHDFLDVETESAPIVDLVRQYSEY